MDKKGKKIYLLPGSSRDRWLRFLLVYQVGPASSCDSCFIFFFGHVYQQVTIINNDKTFGTIITVKNSNWQGMAPDEAKAEFAELVEKLEIDTWYGPLTLD